MSKLDQATVSRVAELARLRLDDAELSHYQIQLSKILQAFESLKTVDVDVLAKQGSSTAAQAFRTDSPRHELSREGFLSRAPDREQDSVRVPAVIERA